MKLPRSAKLRSEQLESRDCPAVVFDFDYTQDANAYFTPARQQLIDFASDALLPYLQDTLAAITPDVPNGNTYSIDFRNEGTGQQVSIDNEIIAADTIRVYMVSAPEATLGAAATGGQAMLNVVGSQTWFDTVLGRGQAGALAAPATDVSVTAIVIHVATDVTFYEDVNAPGAADANDFVSMVQHELIHALGFNSGEPAMQRHIDPILNQFTGPAVTALTGGPVQLTVPDPSHWDDNTLFNGNAPSMLPFLAVGGNRLTDLDAAFLRDVGWESNVVLNPGAIGNNPNPPANPNNNAPPPQGGAAGMFGTGQDTGGGTASLYNADGTLRFTLTPFPGFTGGVRVATGDVNGDGIPDLIAGTGPGRATQVAVFDGRDKTPLFSINPFEAAFTGGVFVTAGDLNGDFTAEIVISPDQGGGPRISVYNGLAKIADFFGIDDANFRGGARPSIGDFNGDGDDDIVVAAGFGGGPRVSIWSNADVLANRVPKVTPLFNGFVFEQALRNGTFVAMGDINGDGLDDLIAGGGPGGGPRVTIFDAASVILNNQVTVLGNFFGGDTNSRGGIRVASNDLNADGTYDIIVGAGAGAGSKVTSYDGATITANGTPPVLFDLSAPPGFTGGVFVG